MFVCLFSILLVIVWLEKGKVYEKWGVGWGGLVHNKECDPEEFKWDL